MYGSNPTSSANSLLGQRSEKIGVRHWRNKSIIGIGAVLKTVRRVTTAWSGSSPPSSANTRFGREVECDRREVGDP